jgi:hypothetical protein
MIFLGESRVEPKLPFVYGPVKRPLRPHFIRKSCKELSVLKRAAEATALRDCESNPYFLDYNFEQFGADKEIPFDR